MPKIKNSALQLTGVGIANMCHRPCASFLSLKLRRIRRQIMFALEDQEAERQKYLDQFAKKDGEGNRVTCPRKEKGKPVFGEDGQPIKTVIFDDIDSFTAAMQSLMDTEVEIEEFVTAEDIEDDRHPDNFSVSSDELDSLGALFVDPEEQSRKAAPSKSAKKKRR